MSIFSTITEALSQLLASPDDSHETIPVQSGTFFHSYNIGLRMTGLTIYCLFLGWTTHNIWLFLILKQRYKDFFILLYYVFFFSLFTTRLVQTATQFRDIYSYRVKATIVAADSFSVCIGLSQMGLIVDLIIVLQFFRAQALEHDRETQLNIDLKLQRLERSQRRKKWFNYFCVSLCILSVASEIIFRIFFDYTKALFILNIELLSLAFGLCIVTIFFLNLQKKVFEDEFKEEQRFFLTSMLSLLVVYGLRFVNMLAIETWNDTYLNMMENQPCFTMTLQFVCHVFYDAFPVIQILARHKKTFSKEEKQTTVVVMTCSHRDTSIALAQAPFDDEAKLLSSMLNLEQIRASALSTGVLQRQAVMQSAMLSEHERDRTIVHEDHKLALLGDDCSESRQSSLNDESQSNTMTQMTQSSQNCMPQQPSFKQHSQTRIGSCLPHTEPGQQQPVTSPTWNEEFHIRESREQVAEQDLSSQLKLPSVGTTRLGTEDPQQQVRRSTQRLSAQMDKGKYYSAGSSYRPSENVLDETQPTAQSNLAVVTVEAGNNQGRVSSRGQTFSSFQDRRRQSMVFIYQRRGL